MDPRERFTDTVEEYRRWRPGYPEALLDWILAPGGVRTVVDLGAGTGISSRAIAARGVAVIGVEPNAAMRAAAEAEGGNVRYVQGDAEATGLPDAVADRVVSGQAFHWFRLDETLREIRRILRPDGAAVAFWNLRARTPFLDAYESLLRARSSYPSVRRPSDVIAALRAQLPHAVEATFPNEQVLDWEGLHGRAWSSSYVAHGVSDAGAFDRELRALFDRFAVAGHVSFAYDTVAVRW
jgi:SAM-dependent methyltransferase